VRPVNLLPEKNRPRRPTGGGKGSSYILLGVLGAVMVGVLLYVLTLNSINSSKGDIAEAKAQAQRADAEALSLGAYGDFAKVAQQRVTSVKSLAQGRFDWERLVRELAHVLPDNVWITNATAAESAAAADGSASSTATATPAPAAGAPVGGPVLTVQGCARDQSEVAVVLVRLRQLQGAEDVKLNHSTRVTDEEAAQASTAGTGPSADCGTTGGKPNYSFEANVSFGIQTSPGTAPTPRDLGGGS
jgi:Tfp pilus assembly protein PilN